MKKLLKILNPLIWCINAFCHNAHLNAWAERQTFADKRGKGEEVEYEPYDFSQDIKYF